MSAARRLFHHNVAGALKVGDQPLRHDLRHENVGVMDALPAREAQREGERRGQVGGIGGAPFYISGPQYEAWKHTDLVIDVVPGRGGMFSLDNGRERRFLVRSEVCAVAPTPERY
jgi:uncharacterized protein (DUF779 family)